MTPAPAPTPTPTPPSSARRFIVALLVAVPWMLLLFQLVVMVPRHDKVFREYGLKLPDLTQACIDVGMWMQRHVLAAFGVLGLAIVVSMLLAYRVSGQPRSRRRWWVLFVLYAIPTVAFLIVWLGVEGPHAKLLEGLRK